MPLIQRMCNRTRSMIHFLLGGCRERFDGNFTTVYQVGIEGPSNCYAKVNTSVVYSSQQPSNGLITKVAIGFVT